MNPEEDTPSFEDMQRDMGMEKMEFMSEMLQPDPPRKDQEEE
jgi:hypothetical protein